MTAFEYLEHTADVKFRAYGKTAEEMLSNAAAALFRSMVDPSAIAVRERWIVKLQAQDLEDLAYQWLPRSSFSSRGVGGLRHIFRQAGAERWLETGG